MRNHNETLSRVGLPSVEVFAKRTLRWFDQATPSDLEAGARWYAEAYDVAASIAPHLDGDIDAAAEVLSAHSPRTHWSLNVTRAVAQVLDPGMTVVGLRANYNRAGRIIAGERLAEVSPDAPKIRAFARAIAGDTEAVVIDVHMLYALGVEESVLKRKGVYNAIAHAVRLAARRRGVDPTTAQAVVWIVARRQNLREQRQGR